MSSTYHILCLSHDPALTITSLGHNRPEDAEVAIRDDGDAHDHCDLIIARYSGALVELGCPPSRDQPAKLRCCHGSTKWIDIDWIRLLAAAYQSTDPGIQKAVADLRQWCLPWDRLRRLRVELDITVKEQPDA